MVTPATQAALLQQMEALMAAKLDAKEAARAHKQAEQLMADESAASTGAGKKKGKGKKK